ncbi:MAG: hypothetical protein WCF22_08710 [Candidatus Sulfotelmatobacter sp.]
MRSVYLAVAVLLLAVSTVFATTSSYVVPTTTLAAQTSNNTSAANSFKTLSNGDLGAGNISKVDVHSLLYSGATTKVYAHMVLWFGESSHLNIGYNSTNPTQVANQINDMVSRGIDGVILDWYGPGNFLDQAALRIMAAAEAHPGFTFAIMIDKGAIEWYSCGGCSPQQALVNDLQYIEKTYFPSPAYMKFQGKPMLTQFNVNLSYPSVSWNAALAEMSTQPVLIFENNDGFTADLTAGSYSWVMPTASDYGLPYLASFYQEGVAHSNESTIGATYKGFNDKYASWGSNRVMPQQCGQTWLQTFSEINGLYNSGKPLPYLQIVTWNDYEEATEIETGIDNCFSLSPSLSSNSLQWAISGDENTVDHYTVYISNDGQNLMPLTDIATGVHSLNLCGFPVPTGDYQLLIQAVGKPSLANHITGAVNYSPSCPNTVSSTPPPPPPAPPTTVTFTASPTNVTLPIGKSGNVMVTAAMESGILNAQIALSCGGLPSTLSCSFSPGSITPGNGKATSTLTISTVAVRRMSSAKQRSTIPIYASWILSFGIVGFAFMGSAQGRRRMQALAIVALIGIGMVSASCGGGTGPQTAVKTAAGTNATHAPVSYPITINGDSSGSKLSATVTVIVQ